MMRRTAWIAAFLSQAFVLAAAEAGPITIREPTHVVTEAREFVPSYPSVLDETREFGFREFTAAEGEASSVQHVNWVETPTGALFDFDFEHSRAGNDSSFARSNAFISLLLAEDTAFTVSGRYAVTDFGTPGRVVAYVLLYDLTAVDAPFADSSISVNTPNEFFELGVPGDADDDNGTSGSLTGILLAGHQYEFNFDYYISAETDSARGARASGCVTLALGGATGAGACGITVAQVPEPSALALLAAAALAAAGGGARRRR